MQTVDEDYTVNLVGGTINFCNRARSRREQCEIEWTKTKAETGTGLQTAGTSAEYIIQECGSFGNRTTRTPGMCRA